MSTQKKKYIKVTTPRAVAAFAYLDKPDTSKFGQNKYKVDLLFDKDDAGITLLKEKATEAAKEAWPKAKLSAIRMPLKDGDKVNSDRADKGKEIYESYKGKYVLTAKTKEPPSLIDSKRNPLPSSVKIFSGDIVKASITFNTGEVDGKLTVACWLNGVQLIEKRSKGRKVADDFADEEDGFVAEGGEETNSEATGDPAKGDF
jgi:hypothetical protein